MGRSACGLVPLRMLQPGAASEGLEASPRSRRANDEGDWRFRLGLRATARTLSKSCCWIDAHDQPGRGAEQDRRVRALCAKLDRLLDGGWPWESGDGRAERKAATQTGRIPRSSPGSSPAPTSPCR